MMLTGTARKIQVRNTSRPSGVDVLMVSAGPDNHQDAEENRAEQGHGPFASGLFVAVFRHPRVAGRSRSEERGDKADGYRKDTGDFPHGET